MWLLGSITDTTFMIAAFPVSVWRGIWDAVRDTPTAEAELIPGRRQDQGPRGPRGPRGPEDRRDDRGGNDPGAGSALLGDPPAGAQEGVAPQPTAPPPPPRSRPMSPGSRAGLAGMTRTYAPFYSAASRAFGGLQKTFRGQANPRQANPQHYANEAVGGESSSQPPSYTSGPPGPGSTSTRATMPVPMKDMPSSAVIAGSVAQGAKPKVQAPATAPVEPTRTERVYPSVPNSAMQTPLPYKTAATISYNEMKGLHKVPRVSDFRPFNAPEVDTQRMEIAALKDELNVQAEEVRYLREAVNEQVLPAIRISTSNPNLNEVTSPDTWSEHDSCRWAAWGAGAKGQQEMDQRTGATHQSPSSEEELTTYMNTEPRRPAKPESLRGEPIGATGGY